MVSRTRLIKDPEVLAKVDTEIAAHVTAWGSLSVDKTEDEIDYWVDRYDPAAVRRTEYRARGRYVDIDTPEDGTGTADIQAQLLATDAEALDQRLDAMAAAVCQRDPRTLEQRRAEALGAIGHGARLPVLRLRGPRLLGRRDAVQRRDRARRRPRRIPDR